MTHFLGFPCLVVGLVVVACAVMSCTPAEAMVAARALSHVDAARPRNHQGQQPKSKPANPVQKPRVPQLQVPGPQLSHTCKELANCEGVSEPDALHRDKNIANMHAMCLRDLPYLKLGQVIPYHSMHVQLQCYKLKHAVAAISLVLSTQWH
jgi:hypothetical protein